MNITKRIEIEKKIVRRAIKTLVDAGYTCSIYDLKDSSEKRKIFDEMISCDEERLRVRKGDISGWIYFVYGNDGFDVICDHTVNLEEVLKPVFEYARKFE